MTRRHSILLFSIALAIGLTALLLLPRLTRAQGGVPLMRPALTADAGTAFTYQGYLEDDGGPAEGTYDFRFHLWEDSVKGSLVASYPPTATMPVMVNEGLFTVALDFGDRAFNGQERWLEIEVNSVKLTPLQQLTPAPYALSLQPGAMISGDKEFKGILNLENTSGSALMVSRAGGPGVRVMSSDRAGILVDSAGGDGMKIVSTVDEGIEITSAGDTGVMVESAGAGFRVISSSTYGLKVESAGSHGVVVDSAGNDGVAVCATGSKSTCDRQLSSNNGVEIGSTEHHGVYIDDAGSSGVFVNEAGFNGLNVESADNHGVYIGSAVKDGMYVTSAADDGVDVAWVYDDGISVCATGTNTTCNRRDDLSNGVEIGNADSYGVWVDHADAGGLYVDNTTGIGVLVSSGGLGGYSVEQTGGNGLIVGTAASHGVYVGSAGYDGLAVCATGSETTCNLDYSTNNGVEIGSSEDNGVYIDDAGTNGLNIASAGEHGVYVGSTVGIGVVVEGAGTDGVAVALAGDNYFQAGPDIDPIFYVDNAGRAYATEHLTTARDFAEMMTLTGDPTEYEPGDVLVISAEQNQGVALSSETFETAVIGVYSTAPGFVGGQPVKDNDLSGMAPVALLGIVPTKVSAENGPIQRGDLLVTSATPGRAMRADDPPPGTVLGKALEPLEEGTGVILVLVTLQ